MDGLPDEFEDFDDGIGSLDDGRKICVSKILVLLGDYGGIIQTALNRKDSVVEILTEAGCVIGFVDRIHKRTHPVGSRSSCVVGRRARIHNIDNHHDEERIRFV